MDDPLDSLEEVTGVDTKPYEDALEDAIDIVDTAVGEVSIL